MMALLEVKDLRTYFKTDNGLARSVDGVSFSIEKGEVLGIVGESGCGKSVTSLSIMKLIPRPPGEIMAGSSIRFRDDDIVAASQKRMREIRGNDIAMIFQEPMTSLNPVFPIGEQIAEALRLHRKLDKAAARRTAIDMLRLVGIPDSEERVDHYPHQLSGGQRQRVMIAIALSCEPDLLIADEPTTALDVTIQAQILELLAEQQRKRGMAMLFITHDLTIVRRIADRVAVMKEGLIVETGPTARIFGSPQHPYTRMLIGAEPRGEPEPVPQGTKVVVEAKGLRVWFPIKRGLLRRTAGHIKAVNHADVAVLAGETVGIVGESGSGKTTLALAIMRLIASEGRIAFMGRDIQGLRSKALRPLRREMQIVFQDPYGSLSPRMSIEQIVGEGLGVHGLEKNRRERVAEILSEVGLDPATMDRYPHEFSGGQRQRIAIARAMILQPKLVVLDEPTSALDMTVQVQIVELLRELQQRHGLAYIFISHDLRVVRALSHEVIVMRNGDVVESGPTRRIFEAPRSDYTRALLAAAFGEAQLAARPELVPAAPASL
jgi:microcin C transport system ATP-binding protein